MQFACVQYLMNFHLQGSINKKFLLRLLIGHLESFIQSITAVYSCGETEPIKRRWGGGMGGITLNFGNECKLKFILLVFELYGISSSNRLD